MDSPAQLCTEYLRSGMQVGKMCVEMRTTTYKILEQPGLVVHGILRSGMQVDSFRPEILSLELEFGHMCKKLGTKFRTNVNKWCIHSV